MHGIGWIMDQINHLLQVELMEFFSHSRRTTTAHHPILMALVVWARLLISWQQETVGMLSRTSTMVAMLIMRLKLKASSHTQASDR